MGFVVIIMPEISYLKLLVPTAGPAPANEKAEYIMKLAKRLRAEVLTLHIVQSLYDKDKCDQGNRALKIFEDAGIRFNVKVNTFLREGELLRTIINFAEDNDVDLIVMGASEDGTMIAEWIVSDLRYKTDLPVVIEPHGFGTITTAI
jgi:nucleotide-binding universal stress UspA family protein